MGSRSKTHHYLPQLILRGFAKAGQVTTRDLQTSRSYLGHISDTAAENNYNTVRLDDGSVSDLAERFIAEEIEGPAAKVLARIADGGWLASEGDREVLARFLALQYLRVPVQREVRDALGDQLLKLDVAAGGPNQLREVLEGIEGRQVSDAEVREGWDLIKDFDDWKLELPREQHVGDTLELAQEFSPGVAAVYEWSVVRFRRKHLLTTDAPVLLVPHRKWPAWSGVGLLTAGHLYFPVDRHTALVLTSKVDEPNVEGRELLPTAAGARALNNGLARAARRRIFHHPEDSLEKLLGQGYELPSPETVSYDDEQTLHVRSALRSMGEWHFDHPDRPHPMSGLSSLPDPPGLRRQ